jgi:ABC-type multidrug transport system fused ATPase/permease subunit
MSKKEKYNNNINNDVEIPLQDLKIPIIEEENDLSLEKDIQRKILKKEKTEVNISFCSRLFFLWTLIVMKLSNKGKLKKEIISESPIFTSEKEKNKFHEDFIFIKQLWEGKKNRGGFNKWSFSPMIFTILRFNLTGLLFLVFLLFIVQSCKMIMLFFKRRIIQLFSMREQNQIENYSDTKFRYMLIQNVSCFLIIELLRFIINHQLKYRQRKLTRKTTSHISLLIYEKFMKQKLLPSNMKEGDLINYLQTDTESMASFFLQISKILIFPYQFITYFIILYKIFGKAFFVGVSTFSLLIVFSIIVEVLYIKNQYRYLTQKDRRINFTSQVIKNIKELKLLQWEDAFKDVVNEKRAQELIFMKKRLNFSVVLIVIHWIMPLLLCLSTLGAYVKINDKLLDIADLMTALEIIDNLRGPIIYLPDRIRELINAYVSMNRVAAYLKINTEKKSNITKKKDNEYSINIVNAKIGINKEKILMSINELKLKKNESAIIIGETGSGKSCLIKSLIDRLIILNKKEFNIDGKISYTSQTPFIINSTVKDNILFYSKYNEERYKKVIKYCELERDIQSLPAGDLTEIGTNGANLSGGQKSRINLARCVYKDADIYLFDDPISSVD